MPQFSRLEINQGDVHLDRGKVYAESGGFVGDLIGDVTGDVTGNVNSVGIHKIVETVALADFTDEEDATGTAELSTDIPIGAVVLSCHITALTGFSSESDTATATVTIGDGTDVDRYMTGTPSVIDDAANGLSLGAVSGVAYHAAAKTPTIILTEDSDFGQFETGSMTVEIIYVT